MKRTLLLFTATVLMASAAMAGPARDVVPANALKKEALRRTTGPKVRDIKLKPSLLAAPARAAEGELQMDWGFCEEPYNAFQLDMFTVNQAIRVSADDATSLAGASLNAILVGTPANPELFDQETGEYGNDIENVTVWLAYELDGKHFAEATGKFDKMGFTWTSVALDTPYIIESGKAFYVGITYDFNVLEKDGEKYSNDCGFVTDYGYPEYPNTCLTYTAINGIDDEGNFVLADHPEWKDLGELIGNACIRINLTGKNLPTNLAYIDESIIPSFTAPGDQVQVLMSVRNKGADILENVSVSLEYGDGTVQTATCPVSIYNYDYELEPYPIGYNGYGIVEAVFKGPSKEGYTDYKVTIPTLNGSAANKAETSVEGMILSLSSGFHKNNVVEEATGTWCGACPAGYTGMKWLAANCEENAIGIALHESDPMSVLNEGNAYADYLQYIEGFPSAFFNRHWKEEVYPSPDGLEEYLTSIKDVPALAQIKATITPVSEDGRTIKLDTKAEFSLSDASDSFGIAYVVVEDGVGPYLQSNYYSGEEPGYGYGFEDKDDYVMLIYDDVARNCSHPGAIESSLPASVAKGTVYDFSTNIELKDVADLNHYRVVPMVINKKAGFIENACVVKSPTYDYTSVKSVTADKAQQMSVRGGKGVITLSGATDNVRIYTADGRFVGPAAGVSTPVAPGFYIVCRNGESAKVIVR